MWLEIGFFAAGCLVTWLVSLRQKCHLESEIRRLEGILSGLPEDVRRELERQKNPEDFEELLLELGYYPTDFGIFTDICPECGEETEIETRPGRGEYRGEAWVECPTCGWSN